MTATSSDIRSPQAPRRRIWIGLLLIIIILGLSIFVFGRLKSTAEVQPPPAPVERAWVVATQPVAAAAYAPTLALQGRVRAPRARAFTAEVAARVETVHQLEGARVEAGAPLIELDTAELELVARRARARVQEAQAAVASEQASIRADRASLARERELVVLANTRLRRTRELRERDLAAEARVDEAREAQATARLRETTRKLAVDQADARLARVRAALAEARAAAEQAELDLRRARLSAPFAGRIGSVDVQPGQRVAPGQRLLLLYPLDDLEIRAEVPSDRLPLLAAAEGNAAATARGQIGGETFTARLARIGGEVAGGSAGVALFLEVTGGFEVLQPGRIVAFDLQLPALEGVIAAPREALYGQNRAYLLRDGRMRSIPVEVVGERRDEDGRLQLLLRGDALEAGAELIVTQVPNAADGLRVRVPGTEQGAADAPAAAAP